MVSDDGTMKLMDHTTADNALIFNTNQTGVYVIMEDAVKGTLPGSSETGDSENSENSAPETGVAPLGLATLVLPILASAAMVASRRREQGRKAE